MYTCTHAYMYTCIYVYTCIHVHMHMYICMYTCTYACIHVHMHTCRYMFLMRDEKEGRKKQARSNNQTRQSNTAHPRQSLFQRKMSCIGWDSNTRHSIHVDTCIHVQMHICIYKCTHVGTCIHVHIHVYMLEQAPADRLTFHVGEIVIIIYIYVLGR